MAATSPYAVVDRRSSPPSVQVPRAYNAAVDFVDRHLSEGRGDKVAFRDDSGELTYAGLLDGVNRAGNALRGLGVQAEQRVLLILQDSVSFPILFFGAVKIGAVPVPASTMLTAADHDYMLRDSRAQVVVISAALYDKVAPALADQPFLKHVIIDGDGDGEPGPASPALPLPALLRSASAELVPAPTTCDDVCFWLYTSGSTGQPKAAVHLQSDLVHTAELYGVAILGVREDDVMFSAAKLFFAYGLGNAMTFPLRVGATALLMAERATPKAVLLRLRGECGPRPTIFGGVPTLFASMLADPGLSREHGLRRCLSAGEALPEEVGRRFRERTGVDILDGIGSTEMLHIFISNRADDIRYGSSGTVVPGYQARLLDEEGREVGPGHSGDLWASGPSSATHYWNKRELSLRTFEGRWTRTGDRYLRTEDDHWIYQGRADDMLKVGGIYVSPFEVEATLVAHELVLEAAVIGEADEHGLIKPKAYVVLRESVLLSRTPAEMPALIEELKAFVKARLAPFKYPRWIEILPELPKTATGKVQRFKLRGHS